MKYQCFSIAYNPVPVLAGWLAGLPACLRVHVGSELWVSECDVYTQARTQARYTALAVSVACMAWYRCLCHFALVHVFLLVLSSPLSLSFSPFVLRRVPVLVGISVNTAHKMLSALSHYSEQLHGRATHTNTLTLTHTISFTFSHSFSAISTVFTLRIGMLLVYKWKYQPH